jgi:hypothetical protein
MDLGSIFLIIALFSLVALFISQPFFDSRLDRSGPQPAPTSLKPGIASAQDNQKYSALLAEHDRILNALSELDFDYSVGKIPEEDFPAQRNQLVEQGVQVLRKLDMFEKNETVSERTSPETSPVEEETTEDRLEAAIAARRLATAPVVGVASNNGGKPVADDDIEIQIAARRRLRQEKAAGFCPQCGGSIQKSDRFCPKCGARQN